MEGEVDMVNCVDTGTGEKGRNETRKSQQQIKKEEVRKKRNTDGTERKLQREMDRGSAWIKLSPREVCGCVDQTRLAMDCRLIYQLLPGINRDV